MACFIGTMNTVQEMALLKLEGGDAEGAKNNLINQNDLKQPPGPDGNGYFKK